MAGPIASLFVKLGLDAREFTQGVQQAQAATNGFTRTAGSRFSNFSTGIQQGFGQAFGLSTVNLVRSGVRFVTDALNDSIDAFKEQEIATARLKTSLDANAPGWQRYQGSIDDATKSTIALGFQDDEFALGLSRVVAATHDVKQALDVMAVAQDLARFKGISLTDAAEALTKVEGGRFRLLGELGIKIDGVTTSEQALAAVRRVASGQASAYLETQAGKEDALNAKLNEQQELLGEKLAPAQLAVNELQLSAISIAADLAAGYGASNKPAAEQATIIQDLFHHVGALIPALDQEGMIFHGLRVDADTLAESLNGTAEQTDELARHAQIATGVIEETAKKLPPVMESMADVFAPASQEKVDAFLQPFRDIGAGVPTELLKGMQQTEGTLTSGLSDLRDLIKNGLTPEDLATTAIGAKTIKLFQKGMASEVIGAKEGAEAVAGASIKALFDVAENGTFGVKGAKAVGAYLGGLFNAGLKSEQVDAILEGAGLSKDAIQGIHDQFPQFFSSGTGAGTKFVNGFKGVPYYKAGQHATSQIISGVKAYSWYSGGWNTAKSWIGGFADKMDAFNWANLINSTIGPYTRGQSPPKKGPLHEVDKWGENVGKSWLGGFQLGMGGGLQMATSRVSSLGVSAPGLAVAASHAPVTINIGRVYGGPAGLRELNAEIQAALRQSTRGANREVGR